MVLLKNLRLWSVRGQHFHQNRSQFRGMLEFVTMLPLQFGQVSE